jgi:hypothetical protein
VSINGLRENPILQAIIALKVLTDMDNKSRKRRESEPSKERATRSRAEETDEEMVDGDQRFIAADGTELEFEDPFGDDYEEEEYEEVEEFDDELNPNEEMDESAHDISPAKETDDELDHEKKEVWRPGIDTLAEGDELEYDPRAYVMYHSLRAEWPCLSFDFLKDNLGDARLRVGSLSFPIDQECLY